MKTVMVHTYLNYRSWNVMHVIHFWTEHHLDAHNHFEHTESYSLRVALSLIEPFLLSCGFSPLIVPSFEAWWWRLCASGSTTRRNQGWLGMGTELAMAHLRSEKLGILGINYAELPYRFLQYEQLPHPAGTIDFHFHIHGALAQEKFAAYSCNVENLQWQLDNLHPWRNTARILWKMTQRTTLSR